MAKIKQKINITQTEDQKIRRKWDEKYGRLYFSVADVMSVLTDTVDARNYWKALKNRLKNSHNQLVMDCNQLKMPSSDGKSYLVDTADSTTILKIIQLVAPHNTTPFKNWFEHIEALESPGKHNHKEVIVKKIVEELNNDESIESEISTGMEILVDVFAKKDKVVVKTFVAGFDPSDLVIAISMNKLIIKGKRERAKPYTATDDFFVQELMWGDFYREIDFDEFFIDVDNAEATELNGMITITLPKIDIDKKRFIKIKSI